VPPCIGCLPTMTAKNVSDAPLRDLGAWSLAPLEGARPGCYLTAAGPFVGPAGVPVSCAPCASRHRP
jgi:hypothetical protein